MALQVEPGFSEKRIALLRRGANGHGLQLAGTVVGNSWRILVTGAQQTEQGSDPEYQRSLGQATTKLEAMELALGRWVTAYAEPVPVPEAPDIIPAPEADFDAATYLEHFLSRHEKA